MAGGQEQCVVCTERINLTVRRRVQCPYCEHVACYACYGRYFEGTLDSHCMSCRKAWRLETMLSLFPAAFVTGPVRARRARVLLESEKARLPEAQAIIVLEAELRSGLEAEERRLKKERIDLWDLQRRLQDPDLKQSEIPALKDLVDAKRRDLRRIRQSIANYTGRIRRLYGTAAGAPARQFSMRCGAPGCRGLVGPSWKCGVCGVPTCSKCHAVLAQGAPAPPGEAGAAAGAPEHVCDPSDVESAALIRSETRNCPSCAVPIFRSSGCDQMWCTECRTAFSWNTGQVVVGGIVHNPHYFEYARRNGGAAPRTPGDIPCGGMPDFATLHKALTRLRYYRELQRNNGKGIAPGTPEIKRHAVYDHALLLFQMVGEAQDQIREKGRRAEGNEPALVSMRVSYLRGHLDEDAWKASLLRREDAVRRAADLRDVYNMFVVTASDLFRRLVAAETATDLENCVRELDALAEYAEESLRRTCKQHRCKVPQQSLHIDQLPFDSYS